MMKRGRVGLKELDFAPRVIKVLFKPANAAIFITFSIESSYSLDVSKAFNS